MSEEAERTQKATWYCRCGKAPAVATCSDEISPVGGTASDRLARESLGMRAHIKLNYGSRSHSLSSEAMKVEREKVNRRDPSANRFVGHSEIEGGYCRPSQQSVRHSDIISAMVHSNHFTTCSRIRISPGLRPSHCRISVQVQPQVLHHQPLQLLVVFPIRRLQALLIRLHCARLTASHTQNRHAFNLLLHMEVT